MFQIKIPRSNLCPRFTPLYLFNKPVAISWQKPHKQGQQGQHKIQLSLFGWKTDKAANGGQHRVVNTKPRPWPRRRGRLCRSIFDAAGCLQLDPTALVVTHCRRLAHLPAAAGFGHRRQVRSRPRGRRRSRHRSLCSGAGQHFLFLFTLAIAHTHNSGSAKARMQQWWWW